MIRNHDSRYAAKPLIMRWDYNIACFSSKWIDDAEIALKQRGGAAQGIAIKGFSAHMLSIIRNVFML